MNKPFVPAGPPPLSGGVFFDPDRFIKNMETGKLPWRTVAAAILFYARQSDCYYRRMEIVPVVHKDGEAA